MRPLRLAWLLATLSLAARAAPAEPAQCQARPEPASTQRLRQVGAEVFARFESPHPYASAQARPTPGALHTQRIHHPGATYIAPWFSRLELEEGDWLVLRAPDGSRSWRYDNTHPGAREGFWGIPIPGDTALVELHGVDPTRRRGVLDKHGYTITRYARGFTQQELGEADVGTTAVCGPDDSGWARCYESSEAQIYNHARAVARLLINGTSACTGWLVGNQGHLLTNNHCIATASDAQNTSYEFMAEGADCTTQCASWGACPGTVVAASGTLVRTDGPRDYSLIQLPGNPSDTYGYLQLRSSGAVVNERIYLPQHPAAYGKKIAVRSSDSSDPSGYAEVYSLTEAACLSGGPQDVGYYADSQGGSSGSPVLGYADHQVVALHHCANCPNRGVPIQEVISHLGSDLPACALRSTDCPDFWGATGEPPPPPPPNPNSFDYSASDTQHATRNTVNHPLWLNAGEQLTLGTCGLSGASFSGDTLLRLFGPAGSEVASNDDACGGRGSHLVYTVPSGAGGTYEVRAGCYSSGSCGGSVAWEVAAASPPPTSSGSFSYSASSTSSATRNTTDGGLSAAAGQVITAGTCGLTGASASGDTFLRLFTASGIEVAASDNACGGTGSQLTYAVPPGADGTFQVRAGCSKNQSCSGTVAWSVQ